MQPRSKRMLYSILAALLLVVGFWLVKNSRFFTETPAYAEVRRDGLFTVRDYPALQLASTPSGEADRNGSFMRLFRFITGANEGKQAIRMTTPVMMTESPAGRRMGFIVPVAVAAAGAPAPTGERVGLESLPAARMAVFRFDGPGDHAASEAAALATLRDWMTRQTLTPSGEPVFAYYDPPWTPGFLRRSEVMIPVKER